MKLLLLIIATAFLSISAQGQQASGNLLVNGKSRWVSEKQLSVVHHFADFKTGKHQILFNLKTSEYPKLSDGKEVALVAFEPIVKLKGREISRSKSSPLPFFPGEMNIPVETFDFISPIFLHQNGLGKKMRQSPELILKQPFSARYEIEIRVELLTGEGKIEPAFLVIII
jgi:hypothetical protein